MISKLKSVGVAGVFLMGCAVGGASGRLVVPTAGAQQPQPPPGAVRWEYFCEDVPHGAAEQTNAANVWGADYWELASWVEYSDNRSRTWCFKRPRA